MYYYIDVKQKNLYKTLLTLFGLAVIAIGGFFLWTNSTEGSLSFNSGISECPVITMANHTTQEGTTAACWSEGVLGRIGDTVNVRINYRNDNQEVLENARVSLIPERDTDIDRYVFRLRLEADNASSLTEDLDLRLSAKSLVESDGLITWYPDASQGQTRDVLIDHSADDLATKTGILLGDIPPATAGVLVVSYRVNPEPNPLLPTTSAQATVSSQEGVEVTSESVIEPKANVSVEPINRSDTLDKTKFPFKIETIGNDSIAEQVILSLSNDREGLQYRDEEVVYEIIAQNRTGRSLRDVTLGFKLPAETDFLATTAGAYNQDTHEVTLFRNAIPPQHSERLLVNIITNSNPKTGPEAVIARAYLAHRDGLIENYDNDDLFTRTDNLVRREQIAQSLQAYGYWGTLLGWLSIVLGIILIIFVVRRILLIRIPRPRLAIARPRFPRIRIPKRKRAESIDYRGHLGG